MTALLPLLALEDNIWLFGVLGAIVLLVLWFIAIYNGLVASRNEKDNAWSQIDVQLKRRHDLIPNLVETAKGYMKHEQETLEKVIQARNMAAGARGPAQAGPAEGALGAALTGLFALSERYPDLKANTNFCPRRRTRSRSLGRPTTMRRRATTPSGRRSRPTW